MRTSLRTTATTVAAFAFVERGGGLVWSITERVEVIPEDRLRRGEKSPAELSEVFEGDEVFAL